MTATDQPPPRPSNCFISSSAASSNPSTSTEFVNTQALDIVGIYPNYAEAYKAWKAAAQRTVDNAHMRYFIVHLHRLLDPEAVGAAAVVTLWRAGVTILHVADTCRG